MSTSTLNPTPIPSSERFIICGGVSIEPWVAADEIFKMDRAATIEWIARGEITSIAKVIAFDLDAGTSRDATSEIASEVMTAWAHDSAFLDSWQYEFVELHVGVVAARNFVCGRAA